MGVKIAFLHGFLKEEVFVEQPQGFEEHDRETHVCRPKKALYGLKQAPRAWYAHIDSYLMKLGFTRSSADQNFYFKIVQECKSMHTLMKMKFKKLCGKVAGPNLTNLTEYRQVIDALMFLVNSRPDICFAVNSLTQHMIDPFHAHWIAAKHVLRYLHGTFNLGLKYTAKNVRLHGYTDADWASNSAYRKSTFRCCFNLGSAMISWMNIMQNSVALSTTEVEYITASMASCEFVWLRKFFRELFEQVLDTTIIYCDNKSGIRLEKNLVFHDKSKHIEIKYHYISDMVQRGAVRLHHISIDDQIADILTKLLPKGKFLDFREQLGLMDVTLSGSGHS
eukprot:PITA_01493